MKSESEIAIERVLIAGHGSIGKRHLGIVRKSLPDVEIMVLRNQFAEKIPEFADQISFSLDEAVKFRPNVAIIANPSSFHLEIAKAMVEIKCHILIEKPISSELNGVNKFLDLVRESNIVCQVGYNLRFCPSLQKFRELIHEGVVGNTMSVRCEIGQYLPEWRPHKDYRHSVSAQQKLGGGVLLELSHEIDYLRWIFKNVNWVSAWMGNLSDLQIDVEDCVNMILSFDSLQTNKEVIASLNMDFIRRDATRICTIIGSEGSLRWDGLKSKIEIFNKKTLKWDILSSYPNEIEQSYIIQWKSFLQSVKTGVSPFVRGEDGLAALEIIEAAKQSALNMGVQKKVITK